MDHKFRTAAVGGFNRQDVLDYLEQQAKQAAQTQQQLQQELAQAQVRGDELTRERDSLQRQLEESRRELETLRQGRDSLEARLAQTERELDASRAQAGQTAGELAQAQTELSALRSRAAALEPDAQAYVQLKERTAGVELEAHRRAQTIQTQAEEAAAALRRRTEQWLRRLRQEYDALCTQVETTVSHAADQLDKAGQSLEQVSEIMQQRDLELAALSQSYASTGPEKAAPPVPIPEE